MENKADRRNTVSRRSFIWRAGVTATGLMTSALAQTNSATGRKAHVVGRRKLGALTAAIDKVPVQGARLPAGVLALSGVEAAKKQS